MAILIALDTSYIVGVLDEGDLWHQSADKLRAELVAQEAETLVFDSVIAETVSILARRLHEKRRSGNRRRL